MAKGLFPSADPEDAKTPEEEKRIESNTNMAAGLIRNRSQALRATRARPSSLAPPPSKPSRIIGERRPSPSEEIAESKESGFFGLRSPEQPSETDINFSNNSALERSPTLGRAGVDKYSWPRNILNFVAGEEMAIFGAKWDEEGFTHSFENFKEQWSEEPLWSIWAAGSLAAMILPPVAASMRFGRLGAKFGKGFRFNKTLQKYQMDEIAQKRLPGEAVKEAFEKRQIPLSALDDTMSPAARQGLIDRGETVDYFKMFDQADTVGKRNLAELQMMEGFGFGDIAKVMTKYGDDEVKDLVQQHGAKALDYLTDAQKSALFARVPAKLMRSGRQHINRYQSMTRLRAKAMLAEDPAMGVSMSKMDFWRLKFNKNFSNAYWHSIHATSPLAAIKSKMGGVIGSWNAPENFTKLITDVPTKDTKIMHHLMHRLDLHHGGGNVPTPPRLDAKAQAWLDNYVDYSTREQARGVASGFLSEAEAAGNPIHITFARRTTPGIKGQVGATQASGLRVTDLDRLDTRRGIGRMKVENELGEQVEEFVFQTSYNPKLSSYALQPRREDIADTWGAFSRGELLDTPEEIFLHGVVNDRMLHDNYITMRDVLTNKNYARKWDDVVRQYGKIPDHMVDLNDVAELSVNNKMRLLRMIGKKSGITADDFIGTGGKLPVVRREIFDEVFDVDSGMLSQARAASTWGEALTTMYKTAKTALNPATHVQNIMGNFSFMHQAGVNPLAPGMIKIGADLSKHFRDFTRAKRVGPDELAKWLSNNTNRTVKYGNSEIRFVDLIGAEGIASPEFAHMKEFMIEEAFDYAEGWEHLNRVYRKIDEDKTPTLKTLLEVVKWAHSPNEGIPDKELGLISKAYRKMVTGNFDNATHLYLQEDIVPKIMMFMKKYDEGYGVNGAIAEVGRRLPMYKNVGAFFKRNRPFALPWVTFPAEAARITKNNLMDHPLRVLPWLRAPQILQSTAYSLGLVDAGAEEETFESIQAAQRGLPQWLQQGSAGRGSGGPIIFGGERGLAAAGAATGAVAGGVLGAYFGGSSPIGAIASAFGGTVAGGVAGYAASALFDDDGEHLRGTTLNWVPHSSFMLQGIRAPDFSFTDINKVYEVLPAEPLAVLKPLYETFAGRDTWGNEIRSENLTDLVSKALAGYIGFVSPPWIQKYGFKQTSPDMAAFTKELNPAIGAGLAAFMGWGLGGGAKGAAVGGALGAAAGLAFNPARIYQDSGLVTDPYTGLTGSTAQDMFFNNVGVVKSYRVMPETALSNQSNKTQHYREVRSYLGRELKYAAANTKAEGDIWDQRTKELLKKIQAVFADESQNPVLAQRRFGNWLEYYLSDLHKHPALRSMSKEEILIRLRDASANAETVRGEQWNAMRDVLYRHRQMTVEQAVSSQRRQMGSAPKLRAPPARY